MLSASIELLLYGFIAVPIYLLFYRFFFLIKYLKDPCFCCHQFYLLGTIYYTLIVFDYFISKVNMSPSLLF